MKLKESLISPKGILVAEKGTELKLIEKGDGGFCFVVLVPTGNKTLVHESKIEGLDEK